MPFVDPSPEYWQEYTPLQQVKHDLIRHYLNGWFPKLGFWAGRIVYFDTHAGRGRHASGKIGSPLVALDTFLNHTSRDDILKKSELEFFFIERDESNADQLRAELSKRGELPKRVRCQVEVGDCFDHLDRLITAFRQRSTRIAPAFFFIDPYGFKVPGRVLSDLMSFDRVELFVNLIWRELDMALRQPETMSDTLSHIFNGDAWRTRICSDDHVQRSEQAVSLIREMTGAKWATHIRMLGPNNATRYLLVHLTNHDAGRVLMKDSMWKTCPVGGFYARRSDDPAQEYLIAPEPDLTPLKEWLISRLPARWQQLKTELRATIWREPHLTDVILSLRKNGIIDGRDYRGRFSSKANPELYRKGDPEK